MVFKTELHLEGNVYPLHFLSVEISQVIDSIGRPSSVIRAGKIEIEMSAVEDDIIIDWMIQPKKKLNGNIVYYEIDEETKFKEVKFEDGFCVEFSEKFNADTDGLTTYFSISAEKVSIGNIEVNNNWPKN
jgi:hypothetical protein